ncbi:MAG: alpha/beta hydrolase [Flavobacteriaceae bacterium]|nr:alpha/beta hydrolase [Flavobacteriaceae bacterium]
MKKLLKYLLYLIILIALALFIVGKINTTSFKEGNLKHTQSWQGQFIDIGEETIRYVQKGEGQDILLIHGTPGSIEDWQPIIDSLSTTHRITAFDRPGNGFSTANNYNYTIKENVNMVNMLIHKLVLDSVVIVGHSYGGSIAAHMATTKNDNIKSYIIVASPLYQFKPETLYKMSTLPIIGKGITVLISKTVAQQKIDEGLLNAFGGNKEILTDTFLDIRKQLWSQSKVLYSTSKERMNYANNLKETSENYKNIDQKVSVLYGKNDDKLIQEDCERLHKDVSNSEILVLKNTAHFIQLERTGELLKVIRKYSINQKEPINETSITKEKLFFLKNEIDLPIKKKIYLSTKNEVILFRPSEFNFGKMVEDNQSDALIKLDGNFEKLTNEIVTTFKNNKNVKITISEKDIVAVNNLSDTLYLDTSKHRYGIVINQLESEPVFLKSGISTNDVIYKINKTFNLNQ